MQLTKRHSQRPAVFFCFFLQNLWGEELCILCVHFGVVWYVLLLQTFAVRFFADSRESSRSTATPRTEGVVSRHAVSVTTQITTLPQMSASDGSSQSASWSSSAAAKRQSMTSSRREELLQQLKAVEDAIAKKRSKMHWLSAMPRKVFLVCCRCDTKCMLRARLSVLQSASEFLCVYTDSDVLLWRHRISQMYSSRITAASCVDLWNHAAEVIVYVQSRLVAVGVLLVARLAVWFCVNMPTACSCIWCWCLIDHISVDASLIHTGSQLKWCQNSNPFTYGWHNWTETYHFNYTNYYLFKVNFTSFSKIHSLVSQIWKFKKLKLKTSVSIVWIPIGYWMSCHCHQLRSMAIDWSPRNRKVNIYLS